MKILSIIGIAVGVAAGLLNAFVGNVALVVFDFLVAGACAWFGKEWW